MHILASAPPRPICRGAGFRPLHGPGPMQDYAPPRRGGGATACRSAATMRMALDTVPVIARDVGDPLEAERLLIESNRQRVKTHSETMREAERLKGIIAEEAQRHMLAGKAANPGATLHQGSPWERRTTTPVAEAVGMKPRTFAKVEAVYSVAEGKKGAPEPVRQVAAHP